MDFCKELKMLDIEITSEMEKKFEIYYEQLVEWNEKINLTTIIERDEVYLKHFYDSLTMIKAVDLNEIKSICDVGSGAGFPSIPLKIVFPHLDITIIDSKNKRITFLNNLINKLELKNVRALNKRAEEEKMKFDLVTSRALANFSIAYELCFPLVKMGGYYIPLLGKEVNYNNNAIEKLGGKIDDIISFTLPIENSSRNIIKIRKIKETPAKYPRAFSQIKKNPL